MGGRGSRFRNKPNVNFIGKVDISSKNDVNLFSKQILDGLAEYKGYEECVIIDKNGDAYHFSGDKYTIEIPKKYNKNAKYDYHNHPHDINRSFSSEDISSWSVGVEYFLTDGQYDYHAKVLKKIPFDPYLLGKAYDYAIKNEIENDDDQHLQCLFLKSEGYIDYERMERHTRI